jgi:hypothetical protein
MLLGSWVFLLVCNRTDVGESDLPSMGDSASRPSARSPEFRAYFEAVIKSSSGLVEAMRKMGYGAPTSIWYHMKKFGVKSPKHWYPRPSARSPEFARYFENVVNTSKTVGEAVHRLGYANSSIIYHHLRRLELEAPLQWRLKPYVSLMRQEHVPLLIMHSEVDRAWSGALIQGEGGIIAHYSKRVDVTALDIRTGMTDPDPIFKLCECFGIVRPQEPRIRPHGWKPVWECVVGGLRAFRVLQEMLPYLFGEKLKEAKKALEFFAPDGYHPGRFGGYDIWPEDEFPLRKRGRLYREASLTSKRRHESKTVEA